jgi:uncharacterized protein
MPTSLSGKICYLELPADDAQVSADFYSKAFGWRARTRGDGRLAFDDTTGEVSGSWVVGRPAVQDVGLLVYIMVDDAEAAVTGIERAGGEIVQPIGGDAPEITARFKDPAGNVLGIYQEPVRPAE